MNSMNVVLVETSAPLREANKPNAWLTRNGRCGLEDAPPGRFTDCRERVSGLLA